MVTLFARNRKHYLIEVEDKNEIMNENVLNHEEKNAAEGKNAKPRKVFKSFRYFVTNNTKYIDYHRERPNLNTIFNMKSKVSIINM